MKVLLIKDVYKLGHAGDVKRVADGYGRNYLLPQGLAVLASAGALKQVQKIKGTADIRRTELNSELKDLAAQIEGLVLSFAAKAGDTGKLYGSITTEDVAKAISEKTRYEVKRQQMDMQPVRNLGEYNAHVRLTMDLVPVVKIIVYREGEVNPVQEAPKAAPAVETPAVVIETPAPEVPVVEAAAPEAPVEEPVAEAPAEEAAPAEPEA
jgi:large subunit ribosomal protein L9